MEEDRKHKDERDIWRDEKRRNESEPRDNDDTKETNKRRSKWLKQRNGKVWTDKCPTCKKEVETWSRMEYECEKLESFYVCK